MFLYLDGVVKVNLSIDIMEEQEGTFVKLTGEIDVFTAPKLKEKLLPLTKITGNKVQVNLENTTYLDSTGLGVFISAFKSSEQNNSELELIHLQDRVLRLFEVTGLHEIMNLKTESH